jgi:hypothetical protein
MHSFATLIARSNIVAISKQHAGIYFSIRSGESITMLDGFSVQPFAESERLVACEFTI